jgi:hypothetical protein
MFYKIKNILKKHSKEKTKHYKYILSLGLYLYIKNKKIIILIYL